MVFLQNLWNAPMPKQIPIKLSSWNQVHCIIDIKDTTLTSKWYSCWCFGCNFISVTNSGNPDVIGVPVKPWRCVASKPDVKRIEGVEPQCVEHICCRRKIVLCRDCLQRRMCHLLDADLQQSPTVAAGYCCKSTSKRFRFPKGRRCNPHLPPS